MLLFGKVKCAKCDFAPLWSRPTAFEKHVNEVHKNVRPYACPTCDKKYSARGSLEVHVKRIHGRGSALSNVSKRTKTKSAIAKSKSKIDLVFDLLLLALVLEHSDPKMIRGDRSSPELFVVDNKNNRGDQDASSRSMGWMEGRPKLCSEKNHSITVYERSQSFLQSVVGLESKFWTPRTGTSQKERNLRSTVLR